MYNMGCLHTAYGREPRLLHMSATGARPASRVANGTLHRALPFKERTERGMNKQIKIELMLLAIGSVAPAAVATLIVLIH